MGQRLIISEEDKKHIKKLYEAETTPPDESVLIANKNPFKYEEYTDARREYSKDLKDGDRFYKLSSHYIGLVKFQFLRDFMTNLVGKTIRHPSRDEIYEFINFELNRWGDIGNVTMSKNGKEPSKYDLDIKYDNNYNPNKIIFEPEGYSSYRFDFPQLNDKLVKEYNEIVKPKLQINNIPDEYFEIRQIKRQQTDF